ncbi:hypothetical protein DYB26_011340 [Aphanomyces astaci]|uniref:JmjC domain-containing protein n=1 Tax=Aphanomyces astaci TaxID=112090 RepID=A0A418CL17_APHAT|nr:hypothetical protein DYB26_011340 [Aphanomyces astaci]
MADSAPTSRTSSEFPFVVDGHSYTSTLTALNGKSFASVDSYSDFLTTTFSGEVPRTKVRTARPSPVWKYMHKLDVPQVNRRKKMCEYVCTVCVDDGATAWEDSLIAMFGNQSSNGATHLRSRHKDLSLLEKRHPVSGRPPSKKPAKRQSVPSPSLSSSTVDDDDSSTSSKPPASTSTTPTTKKRKTTTSTTTKKHTVKHTVISSQATTETVAIYTISTECPALDEADLLATLVHPIAPTTFMDDFYQKKALAVHAPASRFNQLVHEGLDGLDDLGMGFTATSVHGETQGEIELFCAKQGHVTDWHFDFMENFTVQVAGTKTWKLQPGNVAYPVRGCTPHYKTQEVVEQQLKVHRLADPSFQYHPTFDNVSEVTLSPGSVLYFPAGMWHRVECTEDSISMNLSMFPTPHADVVVDALRQVLLQSDKWRRGVSYQTPADARAYMADLLVDLKAQIGKLSAADILPERLLLRGRGGGNAGDEDESDEEEKVPSHVLQLDDPFLLQDSAIDFEPTTLVTLNPLANLMHHADIPSIHHNTGFSPDDLVYILNVGFGHSSYMSSLRLEFQCSTLQASLIDVILEAQTQATQFSLQTLLALSKELEESPKKKSEMRELQVVLHFLTHAGFLTVVHDNVKAP